MSQEAVSWRDLSSSALSFAVPNLRHPLWLWDLWPGDRSAPVSGGPLAV